MFHRYTQRPIGTNWPLFLGSVISLVIHWAILSSAYPERFNGVSSSPLKLRLASNPPIRSLLPEENIAIPVRKNSSKHDQAITNVENNDESSRSAPPVFFPTHLMERPPFPVSAPTPSNYLDKNSLPATMVRLRLFIDVKGKVVDIKIRFPENIKENVSHQIAEMFYATSFIPGNIHGVDLPCHMDIELDLANYVE